MSRKAAQSFEVKIAKGAALFHEGRTYFSGMTLRVSQDDAIALARAGTAYAIGEEDMIEASRGVSRKREAEEAEEEARRRPRSPKFPPATADSTVPMAPPPPLSTN